jgi:inhibitor of cysteine peptidase
MAIIKMYYNSHYRNIASSSNVKWTDTDKRERRARMLTKFTLTLITIILMVSLAGCGVKASTGPNADNSQGNPSDSYPAPNQQLLPIISGKAANIELDASADGTTQQLNKGEIMEITLESNPSTGYSWFATISDPKVVVQMGEPQYQEPVSSSSTPIVGAAGTQTFFLQAVESGTATVTLDYKRGWETDVAPDKTITITVEVK